MKKWWGLIVALVGLAVTIAVVRIVVKPWEREPDVVCPMANACICWEQTHYEGSWDSAGGR
jgi:hypothetical protein